MADRTADDVMLRKKQETTPLGKLFGDDIPIREDTLRDALKKDDHKGNKGITIRPYVGFRDLNGGEDGDPTTRRPHPAVEVGIKISF